MKKQKKRMKVVSPVMTLGLFVLAVALLLGSSIGGTRAALTYYSETYTSRIQMYDIGVTLLENDKAISWRNYSSAGDETWDIQPGELLKEMLAEGEALALGKKYQEDLKVRNTGTINEYVRVSIYKYWLDEDGKKLRDLSPDLIRLNLVNLGTDWIVDEEAGTDERTVLYYNKLLYAEGQGLSETAPFADSLIIDDSIAKKVSQETETNGNYTTITTTYDYDGVSFRIEVEVDAVQEHNAEDAVWSAWGRRVTVNDGTLSLME
ncbi:hypothetical protein [Acetatifactor aquisgranensis]|uniref:hypothetical protein n=1 Tax=Acetatifactor aquisgranensis TaxID=2941233 RepID=UPI00203A6630|nr:hypothetical protein [Acetatifactor aquisgranensis]